MKKLTVIILLLISSLAYANPYALISVSDKTGIQEFAQQLVAAGYDIISTGGTHASIARVIPADRLHQVSDITQFPECFNGRVKTLHPRIHGGILAKRSSQEHQDQLKEFSIPNIDVVVVNLYPFEQVVQKEDTSLDLAIENIDIGGVALTRAAAKNFHDVVIVTDPSDYQNVAEAIAKNEVTPHLRKHLAVKAFAHTAKYDGAICNYLSDGDIATRQYKMIQTLKYGLNPYQKNAALYALNSDASPVQLLNGRLGYINALDALQSWQLVREAKEAFGIPAAASFKHVSPAGVGLGIPLSQEDCNAFNVRSTVKSPVAAAFIRARNGDPKSSFGDWIAVSDEVDEETARLIKVEVSDGIIAPSYSEKALEILKQKKGGTYPIVQIDPSYTNEHLSEFRELFGMGLCQQPNSTRITDEMLANVVTKRCDIQKAKRDLQLAMITLKYTQSNSVVYAKDGQVIGVGSGQQNRVDCVRIAGKKAAMWMLRRHPKVQKLQFKPEVKRPERNNAIVKFIKGHSIDELLLEPQSPLTQEDKKEFLQSSCDISLASDAFFPFEDNIEAAAEFGVKHVVQPGGSVRDQSVVSACDAHDIAMVCNGMRLFTH